MTKECSRQTLRDHVVRASLQNWLIYIIASSIQLSLIWFGYNEIAGTIASNKGIVITGMYVLPIALNEISHFQKSWHLPATILLSTLPVVLCFNHMQVDILSLLTSNGFNGTDCSVGAKLSILYFCSAIVIISHLSSKRLQKL